MEFFTVGVYTYCGEFEVRAFACSTVYANKTDIEKCNNSWEAAWRKKRGDSSSHSKVLSHDSYPTTNECKQQIAEQYGF